MENAVETYIQERLLLSDIWVMMAQSPFSARNTLTQTSALHTFTRTVLGRPPVQGCTAFPNPIPETPPTKPSRFPKAVCGKAFQPASTNSKSKRVQKQAGTAAFMVCKCTWSGSWCCPSSPGGFSIQMNSVRMRELLLSYRNNGCPVFFTYPSFIWYDSVDQIW